MKILIYTLFTLLAAGCFGQQWQLGSSLSSHFPNKEVMPKMHTSFGIDFQLAYSPLFHSPFYFEYRPGWENYSTQTLQQTYQFESGNQTVANVTYTSSVSRHLFGIKTMIGGDYRAIRGFVTPQIGLNSYFSKITIADPNDTDQCQPLEKSTRHRFTGGTYGGTVGFEVAMDKLFPKKFTNPNQHKLVFSSSYSRGIGHAEYVNVRYMSDEVHTTMASHPSTDIQAEFINLSTNSIHEHKIGELYHSPAEYLGFSIGYLIRF